MEYYQKLRDTRTDLNLSQSEVAKIIKTTQQQLYKYESGIQEMTVSRLKALCELYHVSADYILRLPKGLDWPR